MIFLISINRGPTRTPDYETDYVVEISDVDATNYNARCDAITAWLQQNFPGGCFHSEDDPVFHLPCGGWVVAQDVAPNGDPFHPDDVCDLPRYDDSETTPNPNLRSRPSWD